MAVSWLSSLGFRVIFMDAGQADAAIVRAEGKVYLFDVGDPYTPSADYLAAACMGIDAIFLSHPDYDHAGGIADILAVHTPEVIYVPVGWNVQEENETVRDGMLMAKALSVPIVELSAGDKLFLSDHLTAEVCAPAQSESNSNDMSMVVHLKYRDRSILFTGDLPTKLEPDELPVSDILKVPHHGSAYACSDDLLNDVVPKISIISVGDNNYGHPTEETLERLRNAHTQVYRTDECGAITVRINADGEIHLETFLSPEE